MQALSITEWFRLWMHLCNDRLIAASDLAFRYVVFVSVGRIVPVATPAAGYFSVRSCALYAGYHCIYIFCIYI